MKIEIQIIKDAIEIIEKYSSDEDVIKEQCNIILKMAREIKDKYIAK